MFDSVKVEVFFTSWCRREAGSERGVEQARLTKKAALFERLPKTENWGLRTCTN